MTTHTKTIYEFALEHESIPRNAVFVLPGTNHLLQPEHFYLIHLKFIELQTLQSCGIMLSEQFPHLKTKQMDAEDFDSDYDPFKSKAYRMFTYLKKVLHCHSFQDLAKKIRGTEITWINGTTHTV